MICGGSFSGRVYISHHHLVRLFEGSGKFSQQGAGARVGVRLPDSPDAAPRITDTGGRQRGADFGGMMGIIVNHQ